MLLEWPDRGAGLLPPDRSTSRSRWRPSSSSNSAMPASPAIGTLRAARRPHGDGAPVHRRERLQRGAAAAPAGRRLDARLRAAGARRQAHDPDELAAPARRSAGARRQALQRDRASRRQRRAVRGDGTGLRRTGCRRRTSITPISSRACCCSRTSATSAWSRAIRRPRSRSATRPRSTRCCICTSSRCPTCSAGRAARRISNSLLRHGCVPDRGRAPARLVPAAPRRDVAGRGARGVPALWREALRPAIDAPPTWVLRDFHSPNLLWLPQRKGSPRLGMLDFQDAVMGPAAYDLASLLQDARVDVPEETEVALLGRYVRGRRAADAEFRRRRNSSSSTSRSRPSAPARSSASSRGSTCATASRNICVTCRAYGATCSARWRIRRWHRSTTGTSTTCRR